LKIGCQRIVIIGSGKTATELAGYFKKNPSLGYLVVEHFEKFNSTVEEKIRALQVADKVDEILLSDPRATKQESFQVLNFAEINHLNFKYSADLLETATKQFSLDTVAGVPIVEFRPTKLSGWWRIYKRLFDILIATFFIVLTSPIMILTALAIKLTSRGPILFSHYENGEPVTRIGEDGRPFHYFKFRSMRPGTHNLRYTELAAQNTRADGPLVKIKNDPRVTPVGRFIRKLAIDELPEFFLVLGGQMSLVGPRPHYPEEVAKYQPEHRKVHNVKPGITGLAQVSGRAELSFEEEVRLDNYYIENWTPLLDLAIILKTPLAILGKRGAD
jgi:exopolysaccharide biosynthesis polyprenyl glycosylphosphotransferase